MLKVFIASIVIVGIAIAAFAIKMFFIKGSSFKKECSCGRNEEGNGCSSTCEDETEHV
jgi:hypothetical protein